MLNRSILLVISALIILSTALVYADPVMFTNDDEGSVDGDQFRTTTDTRSITVTTSDIPDGNLITDVDVLVDFQKISGFDCDNPGVDKSFPHEISMSLTSPSSTRVKLVFDDSGTASYTNDTNSLRVQVTFDDSALSTVGDIYPRS